MFGEEFSDARRNKKALQQCPLPPMVNHWGQSLFVEALLETRYLAAAVQFESRLGEKEWNCARLEELVTEAAREGAKVIVTPEMGTTGYCWRDRAEVAPLTEPVPGPITERFGALARRLDCYLVIGLAECDPQTDLYYNTAVLLGPDGLVVSYRKTHDYISEPRWAAESFLPPPVVETPYGRLGIIICMDADYMEPSRLLGVSGCDVALLPTCWLDERAPAPAWIARAFENEMYFIAADRYGLERGVQFSGGSCILGPEGEILAASDTGDGIVLAEIDLERPRHKVRMAGRRPEVYQRLASHSYLWNPYPFHVLYGDAGLPCGENILVRVIQSDGPCVPEGKPAPMLTVLPGLSFLPRIPETRAEAEAAAEPADGPTVSRLMAWATEEGGAVVGSFIERVGDNLHVTVALVDHTGLRGRYRALHFGSPEHAWATPGTAEPPVFDLPGARVSLLWGADLIYPEAARLAALQGADVICVSAALNGPGIIGLPQPTAPLPVPAWDKALPYHFHLARLRAYENNTVIAFANRCHLQGIGESGIFGPELGTEEVMVCGGVSAEAQMTIHAGTTDARFPVNPLRAKELLQKRVPALYAPLVRAASAVRAGSNTA